MTAGCGRGTLAVKGGAMSTPQLALPSQRRWSWAYRQPVWAAVAIVSMWVAVLIDAVYGADVVANSVSGDTASFPSAIPIALFACIATIFVAYYGFRSDEHDQPD
jgi:hypothetical protein